MEYWKALRRGKSSGMDGWVFEITQVGLEPREQFLSDGGLKFKLGVGGYEWEAEGMATLWGIGDSFTYDPSDYQCYVD